MKNAKKKAWQTSGALTTGNRTQAVRLQCDFEQTPEFYTVQFNLERFEPNSTPGLAVEALAEILWAVEGNFIRRLVSVNEGVAVSGAGQSVTVKIFDNSSTAAPSVNYRVSAQIVKGTRAAQSHQPLLYIGNTGGAGTPEEVVAPAGNASYTLPANAGINSVFVACAETDNTGAPIASDEILVSFIASATILQQLNYDGCNQWVPVPPGTEIIGVFNNRGAGNISTTVTYGIEG